MAEIFTYEQLCKSYQPVIRFRYPRGLSPLGHRDAPLLRRYRDEDFIEASVKGDGFVLAAAHRTTGKSRDFPVKGKARQ